MLPGLLGRVVSAILIGLILGGAFTGSLMYIFGEAVQESRLVGKLVCGDGFTVHFRSTYRSRYTTCVLAHGVDTSDVERVPSSIPVLKLILPAWIIFSALGYYAVSRADRKRR